MHAADRVRLPASGRGYQGQQLGQLTRRLRLQRGSDSMRGRSQRNRTVGRVLVLVVGANPVRPPSERWHHLMTRTGHYRYRRNRARVIRNSDTCAICGQPLNPDLRWPDPCCTVADHIVPIADGGHNNGAVRAAVTTAAIGSGGRSSKQIGTVGHGEWLWFPHSRSGFFRVYRSRGNWPRRVFPGSEGISPPLGRCPRPRQSRRGLLPLVDTRSEYSQLASASYSKYCRGAATDRSHPFAADSQVQ